MKTFIKTIKTILSVSLIMIGLTALFTIDNAQGLTGLINYAAIMIISFSGGIYLLTLMYPELFDLSEFDGDNNSIFDEYEREIAELREHNLLLIDRYITFKMLIKANNVDRANKAIPINKMVLFPEPKPKPKPARITHWLKLLLTCTNGTSLLLKVSIE